MLQECREVGIVRAIEADEADIDGHRRAAMIDVHGPCVPAKALSFFVQHDVRRLVQRPCRSKASDAAADNRNALATRDHAGVSWFENL